MSPKAPLRPCKVIIVGGGIAGLSLAVMLDKNGIDYTLLEAYDKIVAPKAVAGIAIGPNALRILDQLGCYENLIKRVTAMSSFCLWGPDGEVLVSTDEWHELFTKRYGYPMAWIDRWSLLEVMYDCISDKARLLTGKRVESIKHVNDGVEVVTGDGSTYRGDLVIGADGVHSRVRQEMARHAKELEVKGFDDGDDVPATYACLFGVSSSIPGILDGHSGFGMHKHFSYIVGTGPANTTYWSLIHNLGSTLRGDAVPKFTEDDKMRLVNKHWNDMVGPGLRFSDLYKTQQRAVYTPTREYIHKKWHLGRVFAFGDASHKMTVVLGQGGTQSIETGAALANHLVALLSLPTSDRISSDEIQKMFEQVQGLRAPRVKKMMKDSHFRQRMDAMETPELEEAVLHHVQDLFPGNIMQRWDVILLPAVSLNMFDIPKRPRAVPFNDEAEKQAPKASKL